MQVAKQEKNCTDGQSIDLTPVASRPGAFDALLDKAGAAVYLGTTERHVQRLWAERRIPAVKVGRKVRFRTRDLDAWIEAHTVPEVDR
jgi:excisionase family DNA binding protein